MTRSQCRAQFDLPHMAAGAVDLFGYYGRSCQAAAHFALEKCTDTNEPGRRQARD